MSEIGLAIARIAFDALSEALVWLLERLLGTDDEAAVTEERLDAVRSDGDGTCARR